MPLDVTDHAVARDYVREVKRRLRSGKHDASAERAAEALGRAERGHDAAVLLADRLPDDDLGPETEPEGEELFVSRSPLVSLVQTSVDAKRHQNLFKRVWHAVKQFFVHFTGRKVASVAEIVEGMLQRLVEGTHEFNRVPAECRIDDRARLIVVGDWGSGNQPARELAALMAEEVKAGVDDGREVHVIHLGDVYFAGQADEYRRQVLADGWWPVTTAQAKAGVGSWSLAGNHDLYGGARPYFKVLLGDPRFRLQQSNDKPTSWFRLTTSSWDIIGLDTSWNDDPFERGQTGLLEEPQAEQLAAWIAEDAAKSRLVLTHHQYLTLYDHRLSDLRARGTVPPMHGKLDAIVKSGAITAWMWGHEHRCMAFEDPHVPYPRCLGHGGQLLKPMPPGTTPELPGTWLETSSFPLDGAAWGSLGFAVLDLDGPVISVRYRLGNSAEPVTRSESFS